MKTESPLSFFPGLLGSELIGFLGFGEGSPRSRIHGPSKSRRRCAKCFTALLPWRFRALFGKLGKRGFRCRRWAVDPCRLQLNQIQAFFRRIRFRNQRRIRCPRQIWSFLQWFRIFDIFVLRFFGFAPICLGLITNILLFLQMPVFLKFIGLFALRKLLNFITLHKTACQILLKFW